MNQCSNGNCDVQSIINQCGSGNCNIQDIISQCGLLPDSKQCTDNSTGTATPQVSVPTAPSQPTTPETTTETKTPVTTDSSVSAYEQQVVELVNNYRAQYGLNPVTLNTELSKVARLKSQDMKDKGYFSHTSPTYGSPFDMMKQFGISYRTAGENIAMGQRTPEAVMEAWMNSEGHRANILNSSYTQIGVGYVADGNYWTQMFIG
ncbi:MAG: sporulation protein [Clostridia bacterium]|nr:sporulation protein [Clostridia bacterium]